tara:strand:+ start:440 stop:661 length:222 start_codon:yes stop_codon:yes gene_type:complete
VYSNPINNAINFKAYDDIHLTFDETVAAGSGAIVLSNDLIHELLMLKMPVKCHLVLTVTLQMGMALHLVEAVL